MDDNFPSSNTTINHKEIECPKCGFNIRIPVITNRNLGIDEPLTEATPITHIIEDQQQELRKLRDELVSENKRNTVLLKRNMRYYKILVQYAMTTANRTLLEELEEIVHE